MFSNGVEMNENQDKDKNEASESQVYLQKMQEERGYILDFHKVLAEQDFEFLKGYNALLEAAYLKPRLLDAKTKELIFIAVLMAIRSQPDHLKTHMEMAKQFGATQQEVLEVLEMTLPPTGVPTFMHAYPIWRQVFGV